MNKLPCIREKLTVVIFSFLKCLRFSSPFESWILKIQILSSLLFFKNVEVLILVNYLHVVTHRCGGEGPVNFSINYRLCYQRIILLTYISPFFLHFPVKNLNVHSLYWECFWKYLCVSLKVWHAGQYTQILFGFHYVSGNIL